MKKSPLRNNSAYILFILSRDIVVSVFSSVRLFVSSLLGKKPAPLRENAFLDSVNFVLHIGPKSFWRFPSGIKIGRSLATFLTYVFKKDEAFRETLKK